MHLPHPRNTYFAFSYLNVRDACVCVKIHDIGSRGPLLLHYTVCERHDINSMQIRTVFEPWESSIMVSSASFFSEYSSWSQAGEHFRIVKIGSMIFQIRIVSLSLSPWFRSTSTDDHAYREAVQGSRLSRKSTTAPLITPFRGDLSDTMGYSYIRDKFQHSEEQSVARDPNEVGTIYALEW